MSPGTAVGYWPEKQAWQKRPAASRPEHALEAEIPEGIDAEVLPDLLERVRRGDQLFPGRRVDPVVAGAGDRRGAEAQVHLPRAGGPDHLDQALAGGAPHQAVVHHHHRLPSMTPRTGLNLILTLATRSAWVGLMKVRPDVVVPDQAVLQLDPRRLGEAERHRVGAVGHGEDHLGVGGRVLPRQAAPRFAADPVHRLAEHVAVGPGEVDQLEDAAADRLGAERLQVVDLAVGDPDELARLELAEERGADQVEGAGLAGGHDAAAEPAEDERAESARVDHGVERAARR